MDWLQGMLSKYPELAVYLAIGVGYWVGLDPGSWASSSAA